MNRLFLFATFIFVTDVSAECVSASRANLRERPSVSAPITWTAGRYTPLVKVDRRGSWSQVRDQDGQLHWISSQLITRSYNCLSIRGATGNVRQGPGTQHGLVRMRQFPKYHPFRRLERKGDWYRIKDRFGEKGWVHRSVVWLPKRIMVINEN